MPPYIFDCKPRPKIGSFPSNQEMLDLLIILSIIKGKFTAKTECFFGPCDNIKRQQNRGHFKIEKKQVVHIR